MYLRCTSRGLNINVYVHEQGEDFAQYSRFQAHYTSYSNLLLTITDRSGAMLLWSFTIIITSYRVLVSFLLSFRSLKEIFSSLTNT